MLKTRVSISGTRQGEPTHPLKVKSDQKDGSKTYKTQIETELMVMITSQGAREGASQARFLRALQRSQADGNGEMKTLNRSDNKSLKPGREVQHFPFNTDEGTGPQKHNPDCLTLDWGPPIHAATPRSGACSKLVAGFGKKKTLLF